MCDYKYDDLEPYPDYHPDFPGGIPRVWCDYGMVFAGCNDADMGFMGYCWKCEEGRRRLLGEE